MSEKTPRQLIVETTSRCNLKCPGCYRSIGEHEDHDLDPEVFRSLVSEAATWEPKPEIIPFCHGEPLADASFLDRLRELETLGLPWKFCSNGTIRRMDVFEFALQSKGCRSILFSIDGWRQGTMRELRGAEAPRADALMQELLAIRGDRPQPWLGVRMRRSVQDFAEVQEYVSGWLERGIDMALVCRDVVQQERTQEEAPSCNYLDGMNAVLLADGKLRVCDRRVGTPGFSRAAGESWAALWRRASGVMRTSSWCRRCPQRYNGAGTMGQIKFRDGGTTYSFKEDQFQQIWARHEVRDGVSWR